MGTKDQTDVVPLEELIAAPLKAVVDADFKAARRAADYIERYGFERPERPGDLGSLQMVSFRFEQLGSDGQLRPVEARIPRLSMVPLPLLSVKRADFDFDVHVYHAEPPPPRAPLTLSRVTPGSRDDAETDLRWRASLAARGKGDLTTPDLAPHVDANMRVRVAMEPSDLPAGITRMLAIMGENARIAPKQPPLAFSPERLALEVGIGDPAFVEIRVASPSGEPAAGAALGLVPTEPALASSLFVASSEGELLPDADGVRRAHSDDAGTLVLLVAARDDARLRGRTALALRVSSVVDGIEQTRALPIALRWPLSVWPARVEVGAGKGERAAVVLRTTAADGRALGGVRVRVALPEAARLALAISRGGRRLVPDDEGRIDVVTDDDDGAAELVLAASFWIAPIELRWTASIDGVVHESSLRVEVMSR